MEYGTLYALNTRMISRAPFESVDDAKCSWARTSVLSVCRDVCQLFADHNITNTDINSACCYAIGFNNNKWIATCLVVRGRIAAATLRIMLSVLSVSTTRLDMPKCVTNSVISRGGASLPREHAPCRLWGVMHLTLVPSAATSILFSGTKCFSIIPLCMLPYFFWK